MEQTRAMEPGAHFRDYLGVVWQRKVLCLFVFLLLSSTGIFIVLKVLKPWYQTHSRISMERVRAPISESVGFASEAFYQTQYEIMGSENVAARAAFKLGRSESPEQAMADGQAGIIRGAVTIKPEANNRVVRVRSRQRDPLVAAAIVNALVESYIELAKENEEAREKERQSKLSEQIDLQKLDIDDLRKTIVEFMKDKKLLEQKRQEMVIASRITGLVETEVRARVNAESAEKEYVALRDKLDSGENLLEDVRSAEAERIMATITKYEIDLATMSVGKTRRALETDPKYKVIKELIERYERDYDETMVKAQDQANKRVLTLAENIKSREQKILETINLQMAELQAKLTELVKGLGALARYEELKKELDTHVRMHDELKRKLLTETISDSMSVLNIQILDEARAPKKPAWPNKAQLTVVMVLLGLGLSMGLAFFLNYMDRTVRRPEDVENLLRMPFMGFVPSMQFAGNNSHRQEKVIITDPASGPAESYRKIRAKINVYRRDSHAKTFAITSTTSGEGKTTLASNLALAFAQSGISTLLVDADMRHPKIHDVFEIERVPGLGDVLDGQCPWESVVRSSGATGLALVAAGTGGSRSSELLESPQLDEFLKQASEKYDIIILDSPPVLGVADAAVLSRRTDGTLFVIQASQNTRLLIRRAGIELASADANVIGAVLNRVRSQRGDYYYYHRYYPKRT